MTKILFWICGYYVNIPLLLKYTISYIIYISNCIHFVWLKNRWVCKRVWHYCIRLFDVCSLPFSSHPCLSVILPSSFNSSLQPPCPSFFTCIFLYGWWPQQALANVSSATSSSLQPLMMRKPLLRHWCRVCRQSDRLKHRLTWVANPPRERQRTDRLIDRVSLKLCTKTHCALFLLCRDCFFFFMYIFCLNKWFVF